MNLKYNVQSDYGECMFSHEEDAIQALVLMAPYHNMNIYPEVVKARLDAVGMYEKFPLAIKRVRA